MKNNKHSFHCNQCLLIKEYTHIKEKKMENINIQFGVVLEVNASSLTRGGLGGGAESRFAWRWPD